VRSVKAECSNEHSAGPLGRPRRPPGPQRRAVGHEHDAQAPWASPSMPVVEQGRLPGSLRSQRLAIGDSGSHVPGNGVAGSQRRGSAQSLVGPGRQGLGVEGLVTNQRAIGIALGREACQGRYGEIGHHEVASAGAVTQRRPCFGLSPVRFSYPPGRKHGVDFPLPGAYILS
jgi:hypothetical protein